MICFIVFFDVFSTKKIVTKKHKKCFPKGALRDKIIKIRLDDMPDIECEMRSNVWQAKTLFTLGNIARRVESLLFTVPAKMR